MFSGDFSFYLNSEDVLCPDLPLSTRRAVGGTMAMWRCQLDPYVRVLPTTTASVLPLLLSIPGLPTTAHLTVYLPTAGKDAEFVSALADLDTCVSEIFENFACPVYIRGDFNANPKNLMRANIVSHFCQKFALSNLDFGHPSHHHFVGGGASDSQLDLLLYSGPPAMAESLTSLSCSYRSHEVLCSFLCKNA